MQIKLFWYQLSVQATGLNDCKGKAYFHVNVATYGKIKIDAEKIKADLISISAYKVHGPKGVGALYVRKGTEINPLIDGFTSMYNKRAGVENVPRIVGFETAAKLMFENFENKIRCI